jgi:hypothetical protein
MKCGVVTVPRGFCHGSPHQPLANPLWPVFYSRLGPIVLCVFTSWSCMWLLSIDLSLLVKFNFLPELSSRMLSVLEVSTRCFFLAGCPSLEVDWIGSSSLSPLVVLRYCLGLLFFIKNSLFYRILFFLCFCIYLLPCSLVGAGARDEGTSPLVVIHVAASPVLNVAHFSFSLVY